MATSEEYGLIRGKPIPTDVAPRLIDEPSADWYETYEDKYEVLEGGERRGDNLGKFIVVRNVVIVAPFADVILHKHIHDAALRINALRAKIREEQKRAAVDKNLKVLRMPSNPAILTDAGYVFKFNGTIAVSNSSSDFGRADEEGRAKTVELFREKVGSRFEVNSF